ncbi:MAG: Mov34/MPN/PAD-1 family protein [Fidelibacterota bacterium]
MTEAVGCPETLLETVRQAAASAYPAECCGFLYGTRNGAGTQIRRIHPAKNEHGADRRRRYLISPEQYLEGENLAEAWGLDLVGVYHSHPDHPSAPSTYDLQWALPEWIYLVMSVEHGRPRDMGWWKLSPDRPAFVKIRFVGEKIRNA